MDILWCLFTGHSWGGTSSLNDYQPNVLRKRCYLCGAEDIFPNPDWVEPKTISWDEFMEKLNKNSLDE